MTLLRRTGLDGRTGGRADAAPTSFDSSFVVSHLRNVFPALLALNYGRMQKTCIPRSFTFGSLTLTILYLNLVLGHLDIHSLAQHVSLHRYNR
jgi:hypothetical protein